MAFTYSTTTNRGRVRLLLSDTDTVTAANQIFDDDEIDAFLALEDNDVYSAAAAGARSIAASHAKVAIAWRAMNESVDKKSIPTYFRNLANDYDAKATAGAPTEIIDSQDYRVNALGQQLGEAVGDDLS